MSKYNRLYKCPNCKSILVIPNSCWQPIIKCTVCDKEMKLLDNEFSLVEIVGDKKDDIEKIYSK